MSDNDTVGNRRSVGAFIETGAIFVIREIVRLVVLTFWAVIGLVFWVPLLARMILYFTSSVLVSVFANSSVGKAQSGLDSAVRFYVTGFSKINQAVSNPADDCGIHPLSLRFVLRVLPEILFTAAFWLAIGWATEIVVVDFQTLWDSLLRVFHVGAGD